MIYTDFKREMLILTHLKSDLNTINNLHFLERSASLVTSRVTKNCFLYSFLKFYFFLKNLEFVAPCLTRGAGGTPCWCPGD